MQLPERQSLGLVKLHLQQLDYYGAWQTFNNLAIQDQSRKATLAKWLKSSYELYHFQFEHLFSTLSELYEEKWITHEQFSLAWTHWDHLIQHQGITSAFLVDSLQDAVHHMELYLNSGNYLGFLARLYRFRELLILFLYLQAGKEERVSKYQPGRAPESIDELESYYLNHELGSHYGVYMFLQSKQLIEVIHLRNHSFIGHGRLGVTSTSVWQTYDGKWYRSNSLSVRAFLKDMKILFQDLGVELSENPYHILSGGIARALDALTNVRPELWISLQDEAVFRAYLQQYQYQTLINQVAHEEWPAKLQQSLEFALSLMLGNLNTEQCQAMNHSFTRYSEATSRPLLTNLFLPLAEGRQFSFINYLYAQILVFAKRHDYGEMLIRVYRLMEELMIYFLGYDVDPHVVKLIPRTGLTPRVATSRHTFSGLMEALTQVSDTGSGHRFLTIIREPWWNGVAEAHRHSIVGHGIEAITKEHLEETLDLTLPELLDGLATVIQVLGIKLIANYFDQLNEFILWRYRTLGSP